MPSRHHSVTPDPAFRASPARTERRDRTTACRHDPATRNGASGASSIQCGGPWRPALLVAEGKIGGATEEETVTKIDLGRIGAALSPDESGAYLDLAAELEELGYTTLSTGGQIETLDPFKELVRATEHVRVAGSIISVDRFDADQVAALYRDLESTAPGRFVVGLGGAHGPQPLATLHAYLDRLDAAQVPVTDRIMAALGPRMLDLARERASGALPVLVTPAYAAQARDRLGRDRTLAVEQFAVLETDPQRARTIARGPLGFMGQVEWASAVSVIREMRTRR
jgi:hypothetical protein